MQIGDKAPDFTLPSKSGDDINFHDILKQKNVVLFFYPRDFTHHCTTQACMFRDSYEVFKEAGAEVIGVSSSSNKSHLKFAEKYNLPFILVSDRGDKLRKLYGVPKSPVCCLAG
jgi:peroxiredoxin Q/BCP